MNDKQNEKQSLSIRKIILYTVIIGVALIAVAIFSGILTIGTENDETPYVDETTTQVPE